EPHQFLAQLTGIDPGHLVFHALPAHVETLDAFLASETVENSTQFLVFATQGCSFRAAAAAHLFDALGKPRNGVAEVRRDMLAFRGRPDTAQVGSNRAELARDAFGNILLQLLTQPDQRLGNSPQGSVAMVRCGGIDRSAGAGGCRPRGSRLELSVR